MTRGDVSAREHWLANWLSVRGDIDPLGIAILGRIFRLYPAFEAFRSAELSRLGLTPEVSDLAISLLRNGPPYELNVGALRQEATFPLSSSGAITYRIDCAEKRGLVERRPDKKDRRGVIVGLTPKGLALANQDVDLHLRLVERFLADFSSDERAMLATLLQKLILGLSAP